MKEYQPFLLGMIVGIVALYILSWYMLLWAAGLFLSLLAVVILYHRQLLQITGIQLPKSLPPLRKSGDDKDPSRPIKARAAATSSKK